MAEIYGHIECPYCGYKSGMRITQDKNGKPFGYCEANCNGQMRWGGNSAREAGFNQMHPAIAAKMAGHDGEKSPVTVTDENKPFKSGYSWKRNGG